MNAPRKRLERARGTLSAFNNGKQESVKIRTILYGSVEYAAHALMLLRVDHDSSSILRVRIM